MERGDEKVGPHPAAHAMRPQLGSCPYTAAFTRDEATTDLEMARASASLAAPDVCASMRHVAPSPSHATDFARPCSGHVRLELDLLVMLGCADAWWVCHHACASACRSHAREASGRSSKGQAADIRHGWSRGTSVKVRCAGCGARSPGAMLSLRSRAALLQGCPDL